MKNKKLIILTIILVLVGFVWVKYIKQGKYIADRDIYIADGSKYVESDEYYFNCNNGFFVKKVPPELDRDMLKEGKFIIAEWAFKELKPILEKYLQTAGWENGFEYVVTAHESSMFHVYPKTHHFYKYIEIDDVKYRIKITQAVRKTPLTNYHLDNFSPAYIIINKGHEPGANGKTYLEAVEKAQNSCPDPQ